MVSKQKGEGKLSYHRFNVMFVWLSFLFFLFMQYPLQIEAQSETPTPQTLQELQDAIQSVLHENNTPGAGIALVVDGQLRWTTGFGLADVNSGTPVGNETVFRVGSIAKIFVSLAILKLQEASKLELTDSVNSHVPNLAPSNPWKTSVPVRIVHLLEHTSGLQDAHLYEYAYNAPQLPLVEGLARNPQNRTVQWQPGLYHTYINPGPAIAARVVEVVSGQPYNVFVQEHFFVPLEMEQTSFFLTDDIASQLSKSYRGDGKTEIKHLDSFDWPSGALMATPADMGKLVLFFVNRGSYNGQQLLKPASLARMEQPSTTLAAQAGLTTGYGLNNSTHIADGFVWQGHGGDIEGFHAELRYLPDQGVGYFYVVNSRAGEAPAQIESLIQAYLTHNLAPPAPTTQIQLRPDQLSALTGYYEAIAPRHQFIAFLEPLLLLIRIVPHESSLIIKPLLGGPLEASPPLHSVSETLFRSAEEPVPTVAFVRDREGHQVIQGYKGMNFRQLPAWRVWFRLGITTVSLLLIASSLPFGLLWTPFKLICHRSRQATITGVLLVLPTLLLIAAVWVIIHGAGDEVELIQNFGTLTGTSLALSVLTFLFGITCIAGVIQTVQARKLKLLRVVYGYLILLTLANLTVFVYALRWGLIGIRTWM